MKLKKWNEVKLWQLATAKRIKIDGDKKEVAIYGDFLDLTEEEQKAAADGIKDVVQKVEA